MTFLLSYLAFQIKSDLANPAKVLISRSEGWEDLMTNGTKKDQQLFFIIYIF